MKKNELSELTEKGESETLEFKSSLSLVNEIVEAISALANTKGGTILVGISDTGKIQGVKIGKDTIERLTNKIVDNTDPKVYPAISIKEVDESRTIIIEVKEAVNKPVLAFGRAFKRVGKSTIKMTRDEYERTILEKRKVYFDQQICEGTSLEDIDWNFVKDFFIPKYELMSETKLAGGSKELLGALECIEEDNPTIAGILLFGKNPQEFFMNAFIALARYKGREIGAERLDYKEFEGNLFRQIDDCNRYIKEHMAIMSRLHPMKVEREDIPEYPFFTIRELVVNTVTHRDYSEQRTKIIIKIFDDHIEYYNPGGLSREITPENIARKQFSRNPTIAKVLAKVRYIEELGEGWDKILKEHREHPLKPEMPHITADEYTMSVTIFSVKEKFEEEKKIELSDRQRRIMQYLEKHGRITTRQCANLLGVSNDTALRELSKLMSLGMIRQRGVGRGVYYAL